ncbi:MAG: c-type cytochrome [Acidobacteriota bacterium]|nr:c-type cytochrome [Acidobacteriota bacterium]
MRKNLLAAALFVAVASAPSGRAVELAAAHAIAPVPATAGLPGPVSRVTFHEQVERVLQKNCQTCHHEGGIAPFPLVSYADAYEHRVKMQIVTGNRTMPPWKPDSQCGAALQGNPRLSDGDVAVFLEWLRHGSPEGDATRAPAPLAFDDGWKLGAPDLQLGMTQPFQPDFATGDVYRCFRLPTGLNGQRYLSGIEVAPGNRSMVHHVLLFADTTGATAALDGKDGQPGYPCFGGPGFNAVSPLGAWVPGYRPALLSDGIGIDLPKNATLVMQVHYSARTGGVAPDQTHVALHFAKGPVQKRLLTLPLVNQTFRLPAGQANIPVSASFAAIPYDVTLRNIAPHMHLLGRTMSVTLTPPGGTAACLVNVPDWDFRWQGFYAFVTPVKVSPFSRMDVQASYDNSADNSNNPNKPPKDVTWGENTSDEMCLCYVSFTIDSENLTGAAGLAPTSLETFEPFWEMRTAAAAAPSRDR